MVVQGHEGRVHDDAEGNEQVDEGVKDNDGEELCEANVAGTAVPHAQHIHALDAELADSLLQPGETLSNIFNLGKSFQTSSTWW